MIIIAFHHLRTVYHGRGGNLAYSTEDGVYENRVIYAWDVRSGYLKTGYLRIMYTHTKKLLPL